MADIFISYSRKDREYVDQLKVALDSYGLEVWLDNRIPTGDDWMERIEREVMQCRAMILIMSQDAHESKWVRREILVAEREKKRVFPLLLNGKCFMAVIETQYEDVTNGTLPAQGFFKTIIAYLGLGKTPQIAKDIMQTILLTFDDKETVDQVILALLRTKTTVAAIKRNGTFFRLISVVELLSFTVDYFGKILPADIMVSQLLPKAPNHLALRIDTSISDIRDYMTMNDLQYLPVIDEHSRLVGIVSEQDIALLNK